MDSEPKDYSNPFIEENVLETVIEDDPASGYKKILKQYLLRPSWPDYQEETFVGPTTMDRRVLSLRQEKITEVELKRIRNNTKISLAIGDEGIGIVFSLVLPDKKERTILTTGFDKTGRLFSVLSHALPRHPFHPQEQPQNKNSDELENPTIEIGGKDISIRDIARSHGMDNLDDIKWGNPIVAEFTDFGPTGFRYDVLRSEPKQTSLTPYNQDFSLMEREFRLELEKKTGLLTLRQRPLTQPFFTCTVALPFSISMEKVTDQLKAPGREWRNFFD